MSNSSKTGTVSKIAALLAMAERTNNEHEADAFLRKAQQLATHASIDLAVARAAVAKQEAREQPISRTIAIGELRQRVNKHLVQLFIAVAHANDVQVDIAHNSTYVIAFGMPSDIEVVEAIHNSLATQMVAAAQVWLRTGEWRDSSYIRMERHGYGVIPVRRTHTAQTARGAFYAGFTERVGRRLLEAREAAVAEHAARVPGVGGELLSTAVVLADKAAEVADFHKKTSKARGSWAGYSGAGASGAGGAATAAGRAAGERAQIGRAQGIAATRAVER